MKETGDSALAPYGLAALVRTPGGVVAIFDGAKKDYGKGSARDTISIEYWMKLWCDGGRLPPERFKFVRGKEKVRLTEFKAYQFRAYGFAATVAGKRLFVVTAADVKKQNDASRHVLDRAERVARRLKAKIGI